MHRRRRAKILVYVVVSSSFSSTKKKLSFLEKERKTRLRDLVACDYNSSFFFVFFFFFAFTVVGSYRMPSMSPSLSLHPKFCVSLALAASSCVASCKNSLFLFSVSKVHFGGS